MQSDPPPRVLISADKIAARVRSIGEEVSQTLPDGPLTVLGLMTGGVIFLADIVREVRRPLQLGVVHARSYVGKTAGDLTTSLESMPNVEGRTVLLVDDIFDTGRTLVRVRSEVREHGASDVRTAVMLRKDVPRETDYQPDWVGFDIAREFVVGYGLDLDGEYRHLPYVGVRD